LKRLFFAVELAPELRLRMKALQDELAPALKAKNLDIKWVGPETMHITLRFLGATSDDRVAPLLEAVQRALEGQPAFEIELDGLGAFPSDVEASVLWVGLPDPDRRLSSLASQVEKSVERLAIEAEQRAFRAHLTLGRFKKAAAIPELLQESGDRRFGKVLIREVVLFESLTKPEGAEYRVVGRLPLLPEA